MAAAAPQRSRASSGPDTTNKQRAVAMYESVVACEDGIPGSDLGAPSGREWLRMYFNACDQLHRLCHHMHCMSLLQAFQILTSA